MEFLSDLNRYVVIVGGLGDGRASLHPNQLATARKNKQKRDVDDVTGWYCRVSGLRGVYSTPAGSRMWELL